LSEEEAGLESFVFTMWEFLTPPKKSLDGSTCDTLSGTVCVRIATAMENFIVATRVRKWSVRKGLAVDGMYMVRKEREDVRFSFQMFITRVVDF